MLARRVIKLLRSFPKLFQPLTYTIKRRSTKKRSHNEMDDRNTPTLHLPTLARSKSQAQPRNRFENDAPIIRIRRARSLKPNTNQAMKMFASESNLSKPTLTPSQKGGRTADNLKMSHKNKSLSVSNSLNMNNNSINKYLDENYNNANSSKKSGKMKVGSDVPRVVAEVIGEAANNSRASHQERVRLDRQMVRIINGADPCVQSQVLLNTKTSQPFHSLVKDLGMAVKLSQSRRRVGNRLETLYGKKVASYSQLRSELKVGNNTFYIYADTDEEEDYDNILPSLQHQRHQRYSPNMLHLPSNNRVKRSASNVSERSRSKYSLSRTWSNSSSDVSTTYSNTRYLNTPDEVFYDQNGRRRRYKRRSPGHSPSPHSLTTTTTPTTSSMHLPQERFRHRSVSPAPYVYRAVNSEARSVHFQT